MRHHNKTKKFGRERNQRKALMRSLSRSLILKGRITTTEARAKALRPYVEKMVTRGKNATLANRRYLISELGNDAALVRKLEAAAGKHKERAGGYLRITKVSSRRGDASPMAVIEFVGERE